MLVGPGRGQALDRRRVLMVMERFIARANHVLPESALLKGGLALELRLEGARTTKDIDLRLLGNSDDLDPQLRKMEEFRPDPEDFLYFKITANQGHPTVTGEGVKYDGFRFKVRTSIAGKAYADFGLDVAYGDPILGEPDLLRGTDFFEKYGIPPVTMRTYPPTTPLAEKLHAYTLARDRVDMRLKDLVDMPLLAVALDGMTVSELRRAFEVTYDFRGTHELPPSLPEPPIEWLGPYDRLVAEEELEWGSLEELHAAAAAFVDPVLEGAEGRWSAEAGRWVELRAASVTPSRLTLGPVQEIRCALGRQETSPIVARDCGGRTGAGSDAVASRMEALPARVSVVRAFPEPGHDGRAEGQTQAKPRPGGARAKCDSTVVFETRHLRAHLSVQIGSRQTGSSDVVLPRRVRAGRRSF